MKSMKGFWKGNSRCGKSHLFGIVKLPGTVERQDTPKQLRISVEEILIELVIVEEFLLVGAEQCVWIFVERVSPRLEAMSTHVNSDTDIGSDERRGVTADRCWWNGTVSDRNPAHGGRSHERQPGGYGCHYRQSLSRTDVEALLYKSSSSLSSYRHL